MKITKSDVFAIALIIGGVWGAVEVYQRINATTDPCYPRNIERRQVWIDAHERCMTETNCVYEDWDIRQYDKNLETQAMCEAKDNED